MGGVCGTRMGLCNWGVLQREGRRERGGWLQWVLRRGSQASGIIAGKTTDGRWRGCCGMLEGSSFFTFGSNGGEGVKVFLYPPKRRRYDIKSIKTTSF